ncbi:MAG: PVC-type heme-binding CxxCH protein [Planctomycetaceae bacterium]
MPPIYRLLCCALLLPTVVCRAQDGPADPYADQSRLMVYADDSGTLQPVKSPADWAKRRADILKGMQAAMGPLPHPKRWPDFDLQQTEELRGEGFVRQTCTFAVEEGHRLSIDLYLPQPLPDGERRPAMLALHPTGDLGKRIVAGDGKENRAYAKELAQRGYVVIAPDYPSFGQQADYDFNADSYVSGTMKGIINHRRCVDLLQSLPQVDPERIGVIGHSLGGHNAMFLAVFDERIKAIVSSCGWDPFHFYYNGQLKGWTSDRYMPRIRDVFNLDPNKVPFDFYEVVAALAPRPFLSCSPIEDNNFQVKGVEKAIGRAKEVYHLLGADQNLQLQTPKCGHDFPTETRMAAYAFLDKELQHTPATTIDYSSELPRIPPMSPQEAMNAFETLPGFKVEQTAAEPLVVDPVAMSFDARGRLYVIEMRDYSEQDQAMLGRVSLLTDKDGDGHWDETKVFADKLSWPTAITCYDDGVFVGAPPDLYYLKDTDNDGVADVKKTVFTGFGRSNVQGLMNSFHWGLDNRIHGATSSSGGVVSRPDDPSFKPVDLRGRDFSFDPIKLDLRPESGGAQHGMGFDDWGRKFVCSNSDHCQMVMYDDRYIARNPDFPAPGPRVSIAVDGGQAPVFRISPVEPWRIVRTRLRASGVSPGVVEGGGQPAGYFTGATGITIYRGDALPALRGMAIVGDVGSNLIHRKKLVPDGVGFKAVRVDEGTELLRSSDIWFRPVQYANGPDGCLHILDMYRETIEHPKSLPPEIKQHLDLTSGRDRGRLYRLTPPNLSKSRAFDLAAASTADLVALLGDTNSWQRDTAARLLYERASRGENIAVTSSLAEAKDQPQYQLHRLYSLRSLGQLTEGDVLTALQHEHPEVRTHAVLMAEGFIESQSIRDRLSKLATDSDIHVRYQLAFTAGQFPVEWRLPVLATILQQDAGDRWIRVAAMSSLADGAGQFLTRLLKDDQFVALPTAAAVLTPLANLVGRQNRTQDVTSVLAVVVQATDANRNAAEQVILDLAGSNPKFKQQIAGTPAGESLARLLAEARQLAGASDAAAARRAGAIRLLKLGSWAEDHELLTAAIDPRQPAVVQSAAVDVLGSFPQPEAADVLLSDWARLSPAVRREAEDAVCSRTAGTLRLLAQLESGTIKPADISPGRLQLLQASKDKAISAQAKQLLAKLGSSSRQPIVDQYRDALSRRGDVERGRAVFRKTCSVCHRLENFGYEAGPNLATIKNRGPESVVLNVLDPNREVNPQFQSYIAITADGLTHSGLIQAETATAVTLSRGENKSETLLRSDIEDLRSTGLSLMPEGLEKEVDVAAMADLLAYLESVK